MNTTKSTKNAQRRHVVNTSKAVEQFPFRTPTDIPNISSGKFENSKITHPDSKYLR